MHNQKLSEGRTKASKGKRMRTGYLTQEQSSTSLLYVRCGCGHARQSHMARYCCTPLRNFTCNYSAGNYSAGKIISMIPTLYTWITPIQRPLKPTLSPGYVCMIECLHLIYFTWNPAAILFPRSHCFLPICLLSKLASTTANSTGIH